jgi:hypothetical protein
MRAREIPLMHETIVAALPLADCGRVTWHRDPNDWFESRVPGSFSITRDAGVDGAVPAANEGFFFSFGMPGQVVGFPRFTIDAAEGTIVEMMVRESHDVATGPLWMENYIFHDAVGSCSTQQFDPQVKDQVIFPFSADFDTTIQKGCSYGGFRFTTLEQLVLGGTSSSNAQCVQHASSQGSNIVITAVSYDYGHITVSGGRHSFRME